MGFHAKSLVSLATPRLGLIPSKEIVKVVANLSLTCFTTELTELTENKMKTKEFSVCAIAPDPSLHDLIMLV